MAALLFCFLLCNSQSGNDNAPVGTIWPYVGNLADIPNKWALCDGTNGTPDLRDRFLESYGTFTVGQFINPGLPNITGSFDGRNAQEPVTDADNDGSYFEGALYNKYGIGSYWEGSAEGENAGYRDISFDASRSNQIYGRSNTVQPASYTVYYIIKIKK